MNKKFIVPIIIIAIVLLIVGFNKNSRNTIFGINESTKSIEKDGGTIVLYEIIERSNEIDIQERFNDTKVIMKNRLKSFGINNSFISMENDSKIKVEIPGEILPDNLFSILIQSSKIEFRKAKNSENQFIHSEMQIDEFDSKFILDGTSIKDASVYNNDDGEIGVSIELNKNGAKKFYESSLEKGQIAILLNDEVISAPSVDPNNPIKDGRMIISGDFSEEQARNLVSLLKVNQLPLELRFLGKSTFDIKD